LLALLLFAALDGQAMQVFVLTLASQIFPLDVAASDTVQSVHLKIQGHEGIPPDQQQLFFAGTQLESGRTLSHYNIPDQSILNLVWRFSEDIAVDASGGRASVTAPYAVSDTAGQPAIGQASSQTYTLGAGFWNALLIGPAAPVLTLPADQTLNELATLTVTAMASDTNVPSETLTFTLVSAPAGMTINSASGAIAWTPTEAQGPSTNTVTVKVTDSGTPALSDEGSFKVTVAEVNTAPVLTAPTDLTISEQATLVVSVSATDVDLPANILSYSLVGAPAGMAINSASGTITWTPTEAQGPSTNTVTVRVTDNGAGALSDTKSLKVTVTEVNTAPVLTVPTDLTINELTTLAVSASATDADLPANVLTYSLVSAPPGMTINSTSGAINWTPTEAQGPSTSTVTVTVTDNGTGALSDTKSFKVTVSEANTAPVLTVPTDLTINEQTTLVVSVSAADVDLPANVLSYSLVGAPVGMTINSVSGTITWTPTEAQGPSTNTVTVQVTDNGAGALSDTKNFKVTVTEVNTAPVLTVLTDQTINELATLAVSASASDADLPANILNYSLVSAPAGMTINPISGAITWTPTEAQGPSTNTVTVQVTDNGTGTLSDTKSFKVTVSEVNSAPVLTVPTDQTIAELATLAVSASASDADLPANILTYSLRVPDPVGRGLRSRNRG
jgi:hypothetical protein